MTLDDLLEAARLLRGHYPDALRAEHDIRLVKNDVGNLAITVDGQYAGYVDLSTGEVEIW